MQLGRQGAPVLFQSRSSKSSKSVLMMQTHKFCLDKFDVFGFDLDHTLCKYKLVNLFNVSNALYYYIS